MHLYLQLEVTETIAAFVSGLNFLADCILASFTSAFLLPVETGNAIHIPSNSS